MDEYEAAVARAVTAIRSEDEEQILAAFNAMGPLVVEDVIAELCNGVEDVVRGRDVAALIEGARLPLPNRPEEYVDAVVRNDLRALHALAGGDLSKVLAALVMLIASLQEAAERV